MSMTPLDLAQHLLADVTAYRDGLVSQAASLDSSDDDQERIARNRANLEVAIAGANDQIATFTARIAELETST